MRCLPVEARANLIAASIASEPEFPKYTMSSQGMRFTSASASRPGSREQSSWIRLGKVSLSVSFSAWRTTGWLWPMFETQKPETQSSVRCPSASQRYAPSAFAQTLS